MSKSKYQQEISLTFKYGRDHIRLQELGGHFMVLNHEPAAQTDLMQQDWEITKGNIYDHELPEEIFRRIKANP